MDLSSSFNVCDPEELKAFKKCLTEKGKSASSVVNKVTTLIKRMSKAAKRTNRKTIQYIIKHNHMSKQASKQQIEQTVNASNRQKKNNA